MNYMRNPIKEAKKVKFGKPWTVTIVRRYNEQNGREQSNDPDRFVKRRSSTLTTIMKKSRRPSIFTNMLYSQLNCPETPSTKGSSNATETPNSNGSVGHLSPQPTPFSAQSPGALEPVQIVDMNKFIKMEPKRTNKRRVTEIHEINEESGICDINFTGSDSEEVQMVKNVHFVEQPMIITID